MAAKKKKVAKKKITAKISIAREAVSLRAKVRELTLDLMLARRLLSEATYRDARSAATIDRLEQELEQPRQASNLAAVVSSLQQALRVAEAERDAANAAILSGAEVLRLEGENAQLLAELRHAIALQNRAALEISQGVNGGQKLPEWAIPLDMKG